MHLVTGGSGYFGEILVKNLLDENHKVAIFDLNPPSKEILDQVTFFKGDIRNKESLKSSLKIANYVYHNVAQVPLAKDKKLFKEVNINGLKNVLDLCLKYKTKKIINTSSSAIYGVPKNLPIDELSVPLPAEEYGKAKLEAENLCKEYILKGLNISIVRPRTIIGTGRLGIFEILFDWVKKGKKIPVFDNGNNIYQFIHAEDLAKICILVAKNPSSEIYNAGAQKYSTMRESLEALCKHAKSGSKTFSIPMKPLEIVMNITSRLGISPLGDYHSLMYGRSLYFDNSKILQDLKYKTTYSNDSAICESYDFYLKSLSEINQDDRNFSKHKSKVDRKILKLLEFFL